MLCSAFSCANSIIMKVTFDERIEKIMLLMDQEYYEEAALKLQDCLQEDLYFDQRARVLYDLGYCYQQLRWLEDAIRIYHEYLSEYPDDREVRFYLATAYGSLKWTDESIFELKKILASDPTDVLSYHELALCFKDKGWIKEAIEVMRKAKEQALVHGTDAEIELVEHSLANLEDEFTLIEGEKLKDAFLLALLIQALRIKKSKA